MVSFHEEAFAALADLASDRMATFQELADEAFDDLLRKHGKPIGLRASLKESTEEFRITGTQMKKSKRTDSKE